MTTGTLGTSLYCDCPNRYGVHASCPGREKLGELRSDGLEIQDKRHSGRHVVHLTPRDLLERLAGTVDGSAIVHYVRGLVG